MKFKGCTKKPFATAEAARAQLMLIAKKREADKNPTDKCPRAEYYCDRCGTWHLTSVSKKRFELLENAKKNRDQFSESFFINTEAEHSQKRLNGKTPKETPKFKSGKGSPLYRHNRY